MRERTPRPAGRSDDGKVLDLRQYFEGKQRRQNSERALERQQELMGMIKTFDDLANALLRTYTAKGPAPDRISRIRALLDGQIGRIESMKLTDEEKRWCHWDERKTLLQQRIAEYEQPDQYSQHAS